MIHSQEAGKDEALEAFEYTDAVESIARLPHDIVTLLSDEETISIVNASDILSREVTAKSLFSSIPRYLFAGW